MSDDDISERLRAAAWRPAADADPAGIRRRARRRGAARRGVGAAAAFVVLAGVAAVIADGDDDSTAILAGASSTTTEAERTTTEPVQAGEQTSTTTAPAAATTVTGDAQPATTARPTTTASAPPPTARSYDVVVGVPEVDDDDLPGESALLTFDVVLESDPEIDGGCVWARDLDTGEVYSLGWPRGTLQARFVAVDGVEQPTRLIYVVGDGVYARTGEPLQIRTGAEGVALSKCDVNGDGPDYGAVVVEEAEPHPGGG